MKSRLKDSLGSRAMLSSMIVKEVQTTPGTLLAVNVTLLVSGTKSAAPENEN